MTHPSISIAPPLLYDQSLVWNLRMQRHKEGMREPLPQQSVQEELTN